MRQSEVEERWGLPFWQVVQGLHDQGLSRSEAARALGYADRNPKNGVRIFLNLLERHPEKDPWRGSYRRVPLRYTLETGESFRDAVLRLAKTHTIKEAALAIGYTSSGALRYAMRVRGIEAEFRRRQPSVAPEARKPARRVTREVLEKYIALRLDRVSGRAAAHQLGFHERALRKAVSREFPHLAGKLPSSHNRAAQAWSLPLRKRNA